MMRPDGPTLRLSALAAAVLWVGCGLSVTNERPTYSQLDPPEKSAVDMIIRELTAFNKQVKLRTPYNIDEVVDKEHISVSFEGMIFTGNIGDSIIHVETWENLSDDQRKLIQSWYKSATAAAAEQTYKKLFYQFLAVSQGAKEYMYKVLTPEWVYGHRSLFTVERDSIRTAIAHYDAAGRGSEMRTFLSNTCKPVLSQYGAEYGANFNKGYLASHAAELADPENPTGYMYFICRWIALGKQEAENLTTELNWLRGLANPQ